jgi:dTDP-4-amino-4,6-dideoxygalactose transaminase
VPRLAIDGGTPVRQEFLVFGQPVLGEEEINEVVATLRSRWIGTGPKTLQFERDFAAYTGCQRAFAFSSCTAALHVSLLAAGVKPGDEVLVPAMTFAASANVIVHAGARPVFVDIDPASLNLDLADLERKISPRTRAVVAVHFGGLPLDLAALGRLTKDRGITIVEDAAHAVGAAINGRRIGGFGNFTAFSFYANKNMTTGEGGMIAAGDLSEEVTERIMALRLHGLTRDAWKRFHSREVIHSQVVEAGFKYNMTDIQASLGIHQLKRLETFLARREAVAAHFRRELGAIPGVRFQETPSSYGVLRHGLHLFVLMLDPGAFRVGRDQIVAALRAENIGAAVHYTTLTAEPFYRSLVPDAHRQTPIANRVSESILSLPLRPDFTRQDEDDVVQAVRKVLAHYRR